MGTALRIFRRLRDLIDVDDSAIADGYVPVYRSGSSQHEYEDFDGILPNYLGPQTLTSGATVSWDCSSGRQARLTMGHDVELQVPSNLADGETAYLAIAQDGTGGRALTLAAGLTLRAGTLGDVAGMAAGEKADLSIVRVSSDYRVFLTV